MVDIDAAPDPTEVAHLLKSDLELLQKVADFALEDTIAIASALGITLDPAIAPRQQVYEVIIPKIQLLMVEHGFVESARTDIKKAAGRFGNKTFEKDGHKGLLVGKSLGKDFFDKSRRERREIERERRRGQR